MKRAVLLLWMLLLAAPLHAGVDTILAHGFQPNTAYQVSPFDNVNLYSGELNVNIPIGPKYKTNGSLSYQFSLQHSRAVWAFIDWHGIDTAPSSYTTTIVDTVTASGSHRWMAVRETTTFSLDAPSSDYGGSEPVPMGNAGVGWNVGFGSFGAVSVPEGYLSGTYTEADGAEHEFKPSMHSTSFNDVGASFTQDGSYLRLRKVGGDTNEREIDFPNGTVKHFSCVSACGQAKAQWILRWISDSFGNVLVVERSSDTRPASGQWIWTFVEGTLPDAETRDDPYYHGSSGERTSLLVNRQHRLVFDIYGDYRQTPYPWIGERLVRAELAGPQGDDSMVFSFDYTPVNMLRATVLPWTKDGLLFPYNVPSHTTTFQMLQSMTLPEGAGKWQFDYYPGSTSDGDGISYTYCTAPNWNSTTPCPNGYSYPTSRLAGALRSVKAPTGGGYQYAYEGRGTPIRLCGGHARDAGSYGGGTVLGVAKREEIDADGSVKATWRYSGQGYFKWFIDTNHDGWDDSDTNHNGQWDLGEPLLCRSPVEFLATALDPNGLLTINYHNVDYGLQWYGAPFSPDLEKVDTVQRHDQSQTARYLSSETYSVSMAATSPFVTDLSDAVRRLFRTYRRDNEDATTATKLRAKYANFEESAYECGGDMLPSDCRQINLRETSEHTRYFDDPSTVAFNNTTQIPFTEAMFSDFDGLGHFRQTNSYGNFRAAAKGHPDSGDFDMRGEYTFYNPDVTWQPDANNPTGMPDRLHAWLIELSSRTKIIENGRIGSTHTLYDKTRGYLKATRRLKESSLTNSVWLLPNAQGEIPSLRDVDVPDGADDLLTVYTRRGPAAPGSVYEVVTREEDYGGDGGGLCTAASGECAWSGGQIAVGQGVTSDYALETTLRYGSPALTEYRGCGTGTYVQSSSAVIDHGSGLASSMTGASGLTTGYAYDALGRVTTVTPPGAATPQTYGYKSKTGTGGINQLSVARSGGAASYFTYDDLGRLKSTLRDTPTGPAETTLTYTATGKVLEELLPQATRSNKHSYDALDREKSVRRADGHITDTTYVGGRGAVTLMHDVELAAGNGGSGNPHDVQMSHDLDSFGRLFRANDGAVRAEYSYDALSNLTVATLTATEDNPVTHSPDTQTRRFDHDGRGFLTSETDPEMRGPNGQVLIKSQYDARGHVTAVDYAWSGGGATLPSLNPWSLRMAYDRAERLRDVWQPAATPRGNAPLLKHFDYFTNDDPSGSRNQLAAASRYNYVKDPAATASPATYVVGSAYAYDPCSPGSARCGMLTQVTTSMSKVAGGAETTFLSGTVKYDYDARGNLTRIDYPTPFSDAAPRFINYGYTADVLTDVNEGAAHTPRATLAYYLNGLRKSVQFASVDVHDEISLESDAKLARVGQIVWHWKNGSSDTGLYAYDGAGNISKIGNSDSFQYDKALRLANATVGSLSETYTYDGFGNLKQRGTMKYTVDNTTSRLQAVKSGTQQPRGVEYDDSGNIKTMPDLRTLSPANPTAVLNFEYDAFNRATYTEGTNIGRVYVYDANDERVGVLDFMASNGIRELWSFRSGGRRVLRDVERRYSAGGPSTWTWKEDFVYAGDIITNTISRNASSGQVEVHDLHVDHLGSVRFVTGQQGELLNTTSTGSKYMPFGNLVFDQKLPERMAFTGHERDDDGTAQDESDIDYMHARYYAPSLGRFLSRDAASGTPDLLQGWNRFSYVRNNPLAFHDPNGKEPRAVIYHFSGDGPSKAWIERMEASTGHEVQVRQPTIYAYSQMMDELRGLHSDDVLVLWGHFGFQNGTSFLNLNAAPVQDVHQFRAIPQNANNFYVSLNSLELGLVVSKPSAIILAGCYTGGAGAKLANDVGIPVIGTKTTTWCGINGGGDVQNWLGIALLSLFANRDAKAAADLANERGTGPTVLQETNPGEHPPNEPQ
ncbi:MAG: RHS repeat-associated core domain-containing protein [Acidobacteria bacterium]|nr:RHS repeat-associated core domain-containing protein [Acidobacteriota bacterium]MBV9478854.1 RHS repeat-associated core domain-containing protein [Acidobacteriota bacterium]